MIISQLELGPPVVSNKQQGRFCGVADLVLSPAVLSVKAPIEKNSASTCEQLELGPPVVSNKQQGRFCGVADLVQSYPRRCFQ